MHPWVAILGLLLLLTDGVTSYSQVTGVAGQSIRLPCSYTGEITSACWGRGKCSWLSCGTDIIQTDGYNVIFQKDRRYQLKGYIGERDLSLTIEDADPSDSGLYCCRIEKRGWFNDIKIMQELSIRTETRMEALIGLQHYTPKSNKKHKQHCIVLNHKTASLQHDVTCPKNTAVMWKQQQEGLK
uniref:Ig-like domain-containing protein n=1 Tax=Capra hircus TaxID=9925 RepID=A0A8C2R361_CAPHI